MHQLTLLFKTVLWIFILQFLSFQSSAQNEKLIGVLDFNLVEVDRVNGGSTVLTPLSSSLHQLQNLAYSTADCIFYSIIDRIDNPKLVSVTFDGIITVIGPLNLPGEIIYFVETLAYNKTNNKLYTAGSINGDIANDNDYSSEALMEVNPSDASCVLITTLLDNNAGPNDTDFDDIAFIDNSLFFLDGIPGNQNESIYYEIDFLNIAATTLVFPLLEVTYIPARDFAVIGNELFFPVGDNGLYKYNSSSNTQSYVTDSHSTANFDGIMSGLDFVEYEMLDLLFNDTTICEGTTLDLSIDIDDATVIWNTGETTNSISVTSIGSYWADVYIDNCPFRTDTTFVSFIQEDFPDLNDQILCPGEPIVFDLELDNTYDIIWSDGTTGAIITIDQTGDYFATITLDNCPFTTNTFNVTLAEDPNILISDTLLCPNEQLIIDLELDNSYQINWSNGTSGSAISINQPGEYSATINIGNCIFTTNTFNVSIASIPTIVIADTVLCNNEQLDLDLGLDNSNNVIWSDGTIGSAISINQSGDYSATFTINGCTYSTNNFNVSFLNGLNLSFTDTIICSNSSVQLNLLDSATNINWSPVDGLSCTECTDPIATVSQSTEYLVTGVVNGCQQEAIVNVVVSDASSIYIEATPTGPIPIGEEVTLTAITEPNLTDTGTFEWIQNGIEIDNNTSTITTTILETENLFQISVVDEFGCLTSAELIIASPPSLYDIPSAFTPNGDGINDIFQIKYNGNIQLEVFQIFNRWGQLVFETNDIDTGWDGRQKGSLAPSDVYVYLIKLNLLGEDQQVRSGDVTLIR